MTTCELEPDASLARAMAAPALISAFSMFVIEFPVPSASKVLLVSAWVFEAVVIATPPTVPDVAATAVAVMVPAAKSPDPSRWTIANAVLTEVAVVALFATFPDVEMVLSFESTMLADAEMSALTMDVARLSLEYAMAAEALTSAFTMADEVKFPLASTWAMPSPSPDTRRDVTVTEVNVGSLPTKSARATHPVPLNCRMTPPLFSLMT